MLLLGGIFAILIAFILFSDDEKNEEELTVSQKSGDTRKKSSSGASSFYSNFPDAPKQDEDEKEVARLWLHALEPQDPKLQEKVRKEWQDFAKRYPENIYIPHEIRGGSLTEAEENDILETLDDFTSIDAQFASFASANKYATPGSEVPVLMDEKNANPKEMAKYFDYKIRELESRIQLIEYTMEKSRMSATEDSIAKEDIGNWKKEIANLKEMQEQVPKS